MFWKPQIMKGTNIKERQQKHPLVQQQNDTFSNIVKHIDYQQFQYTLQ